MHLTDMNLLELRRGMEAGDFTAREVTAAYLNRIAARDDQIGAYLTLHAEAALEEAAQMDAARRAGNPCGLLHGIPAALKDNLCTEGLRTTCASRMLENFVPPYSATAWRKLAASGCILLGKTNMDEFAMGSTTENSAFRITRNPINPDRVPGGSSGGSAAAVAEGMAAFALGSDTGGSVRQPAAFCGVVGMKPTYGLVSRYGLVAFASSMDQVGPITRTVADNALVLDAIAGCDPLDATSVSGTEAASSRIGQDVKGLRIGLPRQMMEGGAVAPEVKEAVLHAARTLENLGAQVTEVSLPSVSHALAAYYIMSSAEASSNLSRYDGVRYGFRVDAADLEEMYTATRTEGFGAEVKRRMLLGAFVLSAGHYDQYYRAAQQVRTLVIRDFDRVFGLVDALLSPVAPVTAWPLGSKRDDPMAAYAMDVHSVPANVAGIPALSVPFGRDGQGMPIGVQLMGPAFSEALLYQIGHALENAGEVAR